MPFSVRIRSLLNLTLLLIGMLYLPFSYAEGYESTAKIKNVTQAFLTNTLKPDQGETLEIKISEDTLPNQLPVCLKDISAALPQNTNRESINSVELTCNNESPWRILVPVNVQIMTKVVIAKRTIPPHETITEDDVDYISYDKNRLYNGYFSTTQEIVGNVTSHLVTAGTVLTKKNIQLPVLVYKNQTITLVAQYNTVVVTMQGVAKADGALNTVIKVYNPSSKKTLDAVVVGPNKAQVVT